MADSPNVLRKGPAPIVKAAVDGVVVPGQIRIKGFRLVCAAGGTAQVTDDLGNVIGDLITSTTVPTDTIWLPYVMNIPGYQTTALTGTNAKLYIYAD